MYILKHYLKPENKSKSCDVTKLCMKLALYKIYKNHPGVAGAVL